MCCEFNSDGSLLAVGTTSGTVEVQTYTYIPLLSWEVIWFVWHVIYLLKATRMHTPPSVMQAIMLSANCLASSKYTLTFHSYAC